ncbi:MAG: hypothetical protein II861_02770 [Methanomicrobium sp.]|nr:hypothetical protein [Methanomicrobium sp.]
MSSDSSGLKIASILLFSAAVLAVLSAGCITDCTFGTPVYDGSNLIVILENSGDEKNASVQITIYSLDNFRQVEYDTLVSTVVLRQGINEFSLPVKMKNGSYKLYLYVLENGRRHSAQIRDITVRNGVMAVAPETGVNPVIAETSDIGDEAVTDGGAVKTDAVSDDNSVSAVISGADDNISAVITAVSDNVSAVSDTADANRTES